MSKRRHCDICDKTIGCRYYRLKEHHWMSEKCYSKIHDICPECINELKKLRKMKDNDND